MKRQKPIISELLFLLIASPVIAIAIYLLKKFGGSN